MGKINAIIQDTLLCQNDLPDSAMAAAYKEGLVAWDIETSGLDWKNDRIGTCQIYVPQHHAYIVKMGDGLHTNLISLLAEQGICKIFHHAMFDLRFMVNHWSTEVNNVTCTRIASKIVDPDRESHSLKNLLGDYLDIYLDKTLQASDWLAEKLTKEQLNYAVADVIYLPILYQFLKRNLVESGRWGLAEASFNYLPTRAKLDVLGFGDLFQY